MRRQSAATSRQALFIGSKPLGLAALRAMVQAIPGAVAGVVTLDDSDDARSALPDFHAYCSEAGLSLSVLTGPGQLREMVDQHAPTFVLVVGWYWLIPRDVLRSVPEGFVGVHGSRLPKYRGHAPLVWAVLRGDTETAVTMFYLSDGMDTGDIVGQEAFPIAPEDTIAEVMGKATAATESLVATYSAKLLEGVAPRRKQGLAQVSYVSLRRPEDGLINWSRSAIEVHNSVRAQTRPYPGAFAILPDGRTLHIWRSSLFPFPYHGIPGLVGQPHEDGIVVVCGDGAVVVRECSVDGLPVAPRAVLRWGMRLRGQGV